MILSTGTLSLWWADSKMAPGNLHMPVFIPCVIPLRVGWPIEYKSVMGCHLYNYVKISTLLTDSLVFSASYFDEISGHVGEVHMAKN